MPYGGTGSGGGGGVRLLTKSTNNQPCVFVSAAAATTYFQTAGNEADAALIESGAYALGIGPVAEAYPSADNTYYVHNVSSDTWEIALGLQGPEGEPGQPGSTPNVLIDNVNQAGHGFTQAMADAGLAVYSNNGTWERADNSSLDTAATALYW